MPNHRRRSLYPASLLCAAAVALAALPADASAGSQRAAEGAGRSAERAARSERAEQRRAARAEQRAERRAARAKARGERQAERAERQAARGRAHGDSEAGEQLGSGATGEGMLGSGAAPSESRPVDAAPRGASVRGCSITAAASSASIVVGETVTISGSVSCPAGLSAGAQQLTIAESEAGSAASAATPATAKAADAGGSYSFSSGPLNANTVFRVRLGRSGARTVVKVAPRITLSGPAPTAQSSTLAASEGSRRRATFIGAVDPAATGALVGLQIATPSSAGQWRTVSYARVGSDGSFAIGHNFRTSGETMLRAIAYAGKHKAAALSNALSYDAPQPQNPRLTIDASADPASAGQVVTLTGAATGAGHQTVTLLARTPGSALVAVATTTTDEAGDYTFTQAPLENTYYRVSGPGASSTLLFEAVAFTVTPDAAPATVKVGEQVSFSGTLAPSAVGWTVRLEQAAGVRFQTLSTGVTNSESKYAIAYTFTHPGSYTIRIRSAGDGKNQLGGSEPLTVLVTE